MFAVKPAKENPSFKMQNETFCHDQMRESQEVRKLEKQIELLRIEVMTKEKIEADHARF